MLKLNILFLLNFILNNYIDKYISICSDIENGIEKPKVKNDILTGYSGEKLITALQLFCKELEGSSNVYLEIGVFQGLTLLSNALHNKNISCFGIDNFSLFNEDGNNKKIVEERASKLNINNIKLIDMDFEAALDNLDKYLGGKKVGVFFIDGAHDYRSQLVSLLKIKEYLSDNCVIIIDDANYAHVRQATKDFLSSEKSFKMICEAYTKAHPANLSLNEKKIAIDVWWNGVNILVKDNNNYLSNISPDIEMEYRDQHFYNHDFMRTKYTEIISKIFNITLEYIQSKDIKILKKAKTLINEHDKKYFSRFKDHNTYSQNLTNFRVNK